MSRYSVVVKYKERAPVKFYDFDRADLALRSLAYIKRELCEHNPHAWRVWIETDGDADEPGRIRQNAPR